MKNQLLKSLIIALFLHATVVVGLYLVFKIDSGKKENETSKPPADHHDFVISQDQQSTPPLPDPIIDRPGRSAPPNNNTKNTETKPAPPQDPKTIVHINNADASKTKTESSEITPDEHVVKSGEGFWVIAKKYNVTQNELRKFNGLSENYVLKPGDRLKIPPRN